jgi:DNA-3-methyladenine glycosylase II
MTGMTYVMRDHLGWDNTGTAWLRAANTPAGDVVVLTAAEPPPHGSAMDTFTAPAQWPDTMPPTLANALTSVGPVRRWATPSLWDAIATAIIRQVIRADQARLHHQRFRRQHGPAVPTDSGTLYALPRPETVAALERADFQRLGMAFKADALRNAAVAYLDHHATWLQLPPPQLLQELQSVPRIGPWTAGAAVADFTHDWSLYPYGDLAVRTWAKRAAPDVAWPTSEPEFAERWRTITGHHLGTITLFTLAWGARCAAPSDP